MKQVSNLCVLLLLFFVSNVVAQQAQSNDLPNGFLVKFETDVSPAEVRAKNILRADNGIREGEYFEHLGVWYIEYEPSKTTKSKALQILRLTTDTIAWSDGIRG